MTTHGGVLSTKACQEWGRGGNGLWKNARVSEGMNERMNECIECVGIHKAVSFSDSAEFLTE